MGKGLIKVWEGASGGGWESQRCEASMAGFSSHGRRVGVGGRVRDAKHRWLGFQEMVVGGGGG